MMTARLTTGRSNREVASALMITPATAEQYVANILSKLGLRSRNEIAM